MTIEEAIQKAIEGGWTREALDLACEMDSYDHVFLDPEFWKCLGKGLGWGLYRGQRICEVCDKCGNVDCGRGIYCGNDKKSYIKASLFQWHKFIDKLASGGTAEEFFKEL